MSENLPNEIEEVETEKERRIFWQDLCYYAMNTLDRILGYSVINGTGTHKDNFKERINEVEIKNDRIQQLQDQIKILVSLRLITSSERKVFIQKIISLAENTDV